MYLSEMRGKVKTYQISKLCMTPLLIKATFLDLDLDFLAFLNWTVFQKVSRQMFLNHEMEIIWIEWQKI